MLNSVLSFIVALGILVFIHEYGHYSVARYFKVRVIRFSVGFGNPIFKWVNPKNQVEWTVSWIPLGGYVRMLDERDPESLLGSNIDLSQAFNRKPVLQRILIVLAGPVANLGLAALLYAVLAYSVPTGIAATAGQPEQASVAAQAGLQAGDNIASINKSPTHTWSDVSWALLKARLFENDLEVTVQRGGVDIALPTIPAGSLAAEIGPDLPREFGFLPHEKAIRVRAITPGSPAEGSNFQVGDQLLRLNGKIIENAAQFTRAIQQNPGLPVEVEIRRSTDEFRVTVVPAAVVLNDKTVGRLGLGIAGDVDTVTNQLGFAESIGQGVNKMVEISVFSLAALGKMITGDLSWNHLSGPVSIASAAGESSSLGILPFIGFLAMVSVSLGVLNLLPIPLLDGGHLMYYFAEIVRGKPVSEATQILGQKIGVLLIAGMTTVALFNDIQRLF